MQLLLYVICLGHVDVEAPVVLESSEKSMILNVNVGDRTYYSTVCSAQNNMELTWEKGCCERDGFGEEEMLKTSQDLSHSLCPLYLTLQIHGDIIDESTTTTLLSPTKMKDYLGLSFPNTGTENED